ncbi:MAG: glycerophosphodiester phosphodiesterase [Candidatus Micrarchaeaceae archaeon]
MRGDRAAGRGQEKFLIIGHRGVPHLAPENTLRSFQMALASGADGVELDVQITKDGVPIVFHDFTALRMCGNDNSISAMNFREVRDLRVAGSELIPTLKEVLELTSGSVVFAELKISADKDVTYKKNMCIRVREVIEASGVASNVIITSFDHEALSLYRDIDRHQKIGIIYDRESMTFYLEHGIDQAAIIDSYDVLVPEYTYHTVEALRVLSESGKTIFPWTVNDPSTAKILRFNGVRGIITDFADIMQSSRTKS